MLKYLKAANFQCDELVVGATLEALEFAKENSLPVLTNGRVVYSDLDFIKGRSAQELCDISKIKFAMFGKLLMPHTEKIFYRDDHLSIISDASSQKLFFNKIYLFDPEEIENLKSESVKYHIIDLFQRTYWKTPEELIFDTNDNFHKRIQFVEPGRILVHSILSKKELFSQFSSEFFTKKKLYWWSRQMGFKSHVSNNKIRLKLLERYKKKIIVPILPDNIENKVLSYERDGWHSPFSKERFNL